MDYIVLLTTLFLPLLTAISCLIFWGKPNVQNYISTVGSILTFASAILLFHQVTIHDYVVVGLGGWQFPFGILFAADYFSVILILTSTLLSACAVMYASSAMDENRKSYGFFALWHFLIFGIIGAFLTTDIFNLYVWFEIMLISSFVLLALGGKRDQLEGAIKYVTLNFIASAIFLAGVGTIYSITGSLNFADLHQKAINIDAPGRLSLAGVFFFVSFGIKAAVFPLFFWLPASYHTPPIAISAIFAGLLTKVGIYAMVRVFTLIFTHDPIFTKTIILTISGLTMVVGVLGAAVQFEFRRLLSFHIISQIGYMLMGLAIFTPLAFTGVVFFIVHNILVKSSLFLVAGIVYKYNNTYDLKKLGGFYLKNPWLSIVFFILAMSLAGLPPFSGFWGKFILVKAGLEAEQYFIIAVSLGVSLFTLYSMTKIWNEVFWKKLPVFKNKIDETEEPLVTMPVNGLTKMWVPLIILTVVVLFIGLYAEPLYQVSAKAAEQISNPAIYFENVTKPAN
ncbi:MAG: Na+/H+ antiporter subunit D [Chitinophagaceae bacterium]|nr:MAG: Na+/H+ antiporter subunit D [Chitinophagaceae bacterium]